MIATFLSSRKVPDERCVTSRKILHRERVPLYQGSGRRKSSSKLFSYKVLAGESANASPFHRTWVVCG